MLAILPICQNYSPPPILFFIRLSVPSIDHSAAESQYTEFKFWISESEDHYKPELAQLLYPLFTHLYIALLLGCPAAAPPSTGRDCPC